MSVRECIRVCTRSVRHINWQTGTAVSEVDTSNLLLQKWMPSPECASLISNLVLISSCCPLRRIRWQVLFEERTPNPPPPSLRLSPFPCLHLFLTVTDFPQFTTKTWRLERIYQSGRWLNWAKHFVNATNGRFWNAITVKLYETQHLRDSVSSFFTREYIWFRHPHVFLSAVMEVH